MGKSNCNNGAPWIKSLQNEYCSNVIQDNNCSTTISMLEKAINRLQDKKSPRSHRRILVKIFEILRKQTYHTFQQHVQWQH